MFEGSLRTWRGTIRSGTDDFQFEVFLPEQFPDVPPVVRSLTPINHPHVNKDGFVSLQILNRWKKEFHAYQAIVQLISLMKRHSPTRTKLGTPNYQLRSTSQSFQGSSPNYQSPVPAVNTPKEKQELANLNKQITHLKEDVTKRDEELSRLRARDAIGISKSSSGHSSYRHLESKDQVAELESEQIAVSDLMTSLHDKYTEGEISIFDYSKLYKKYSRDLYILSKKLEYVKSKQ